MCGHYIETQYAQAVSTINDILFNGVDMLFSNREADFEKDFPKTSRRFKFSGGIYLTNFRERSGLEDYVRYSRIFGEELGKLGFWKKCTTDGDLFNDIAVSLVEKLDLKKTPEEIVKDATEICANKLRIEPEFFVEQYVKGLSSGKKGAQRNKERVEKILACIHI
ncbi:MAG: hypothetical protein V1839_03620 [archaeon]